MTTEPLTGYGGIIADAIGVHDKAVVELVESLMREEHPTLDALSPAVFTACAKDAYTEAREWAVLCTIGGISLPDYCRTNGLTVPEFPVDVS